MFWSQEVAQDRVLEAQMMVMTVITGVLDAATYLKFRVFATKQTGEHFNILLNILHTRRLMIRQGIPFSSQSTPSTLASLDIGLSLTSPSPSWSLYWAALFLDKLATRFGNAVEAGFALLLASRCYC